MNTVFQSYALFPHLDVGENVSVGLRRRGVKDASGGAAAAAPPPPPPPPPPVHRTLVRSGRGDASPRSSTWPLDGCSGQATMRSVVSCRTPEQAKKEPDGV